jgi:hypothetical protein
MVRTITSYTFEAEAIEPLLTLYCFIAVHAYVSAFSNVWGDDRGGDVGMPRRAHVMT